MLNDPILWPTPSLLVTWEWKLRWEIRVCISWTVSWSNFFFSELWAVLEFGS